MESENKEIVINIQNVSKTFNIRDNANSSIRNKMFNIFKQTTKHKIEALKNINIEVSKGEVLGIIGRNGSGKSTLINLISSAILPDKGGKVATKGKFIRLSLGLGFDPELTARENIYLNASILGLTFKKIGHKFQGIIDFAGLDEFKDSKVKYFSSGMRTRLAFAVAMNCEAEILLFDEFFGGVGDENFRIKSEKIFYDQFIKDKTIIHISHNLGLIEKYSNRVILINKGEIITCGEPMEVVALYKEKYIN